MQTIKKILVPLDGSSYSKRALDLAISIAKNRDISITGIHVIRMPIEFSNEIKKQYQKNAEKIINTASNISEKANIPFKQKITTNGYVGKEITKFAENNKIDLIIIGSRGPNSIAEMFLGSVANYVMIKSKIPVLIVK